MRVGQVLFLNLMGVGLVPLRPSLRCALTLCALPGGFPGLIRDIQDDSLTAAIDVLNAAGIDAPFLDHKIMTTGLPVLRPILLELVLSCAGLDLDMQTEATPDDAPRISFQDFLSDLFQKATGWLGWPPDIALDASPAEIVLAVKGRTDLLKMLFGAADKPEPGSLDKQARTAFGALGSVIVKRPKRVM